MRRSPAAQNAMLSDELFMKHAIAEARRTGAADDVPVGAVIVHKGRVIARGHNQVELLRDPTAHAEMIALTSAAQYLQGKWLSGCTLYVTIEPCPMWLSPELTFIFPYLSISMSAAEPSYPYHLATNLLPFTCTWQATPIPRFFK